MIIELPYKLALQNLAAGYLRMDIYIYICCFLKIPKYLQRAQFDKRFHSHNGKKVDINRSLKIK